MNKYWLLFIVFIGLNVSLLAQNELFENYKPIEAKGEIPKEFVTRFSDVVSEEIDDFVSGSDSKTKRYKTDFLIRSTFSTKKVLLSGKVLFNDPVTVYINKVAAKIFAANKSLDKNSFRIYAYKSPIVNAFAFEDGLVLINLGLLAQLENEAQLALILCHEFTHYVNHDAIELFLESKEIDQGAGMYKNISYDDKMLYKSKYSQEKESTADLQGLSYYKNTNYSLKPVNGVFDVLKYSYLPFDDIPFDSSYFEFDAYVFPTEYKLKEVNPIAADGLEQDEDEAILKSHPGAEERREEILNHITLSEIKDESKKIFIAGSEAEFQKIRNICRFEMPRMYLLHGYYEMAFYNAYLLEEKGFKNNLYLNQMKALAIGQMARKINVGTRVSKSSLSDVKENIQGESQQVYFILNSLGRNKKEFNVFAVQFAYKMLLKHPNDEVLKTNFEDLALALFEETRLKFSDFLRTAQTPKTTENLNEKEKAVAESKSEKEKLMDAIRSKDSKYKKIEKKVYTETEVEDEDGNVVINRTKKGAYFEFAFSEYLNDKIFTTTLKEKEKQYKKSKEDNKTDKEKAIAAKIKRLNNNRGYALGIDKITIVNPLYNAVDKNGNNAYKSEKGQEELNDVLSQLAKKAKLEVDIIDVNKASLLNTKAYNHAATLNEWIGEQFLFSDPIEFTSIEREKMQSIMKNYDSRYFLWTGIVSNKSKKYTLFFNVLFDLESNAVKFNSFKTLNARSTKTIIKSEMYHIFNQIKTKRKI